MSNVRATLAIARVTFIDIVRGKIFYSAIAFAIVLIGIGFLASRLTYIKQDRMILDFGLSILTIILATLSTVLGSVLIPMEFDRRTVFVALSKPIARWQFLLGKALGLQAALTINWLLLCAASSVIFMKADGVISSAHVWAAFFSLVQACVLAMLAITVSIHSTPMLASIISIGVYLAGVNASQFRFLAPRMDSEIARTFVGAVSQIIPSFETFNLGFKATYGIPLSAEYIMGALAYGFFLFLIFFVSGVWLLNRRET